MWLDYGLQTAAPRPHDVVVRQVGLEGGLTALSSLFRLVANCTAAQDGYLTLVNALDGVSLPACLTQQIAFIISVVNGHTSKFGKYASQHVTQNESSIEYELEWSTRPTWRTASALALKVAEERGTINLHDIVAVAGDTASDALLHEILQHTVEIWSACAQCVNEPAPEIQADIIMSKMAMLTSTSRQVPWGAWGNFDTVTLRTAHQTGITMPVPAIYIISENTVMQRHVVSATRGLGYAIEFFLSIAAFTASRQSVGPCCVLVDMALFRPSDALLLSLTVNIRIALPLIFFNEILPVNAPLASDMHAFSPVALREAIRQSLCADFNRIDAQARQEDLRERYLSLTQRERQVLNYVRLGLLNKQIAGILQISEITVKLHRRHLMRKLGARNPVDLGIKVSQLVEA